MTYGLQVINDSGFVQIDDNFTNYVLLAKGSAVSSSANPYGFHGYFEALVGHDVLVTGDSPVVAMRCASGTNWLLASVSLGKVTDLSYVIAGLVINDAGNAYVNGQVIEWALFVRRPATPTGAFGLRVYNAAGGLVFDSGKKQYRVTQVLNLHPWEIAGAPSKTLGLSSSAHPWITNTLSMLYVGVPGSDPHPSNLIFWRFAFRSPYPGVLQTAGVAFHIYDGLQGIGRPEGYPAGALIWAPVSGVEY